MEAECPTVTRKREQAIKIKSEEMKKKFLRIVYLYDLNRILFRLLFVQIFKEVIKSSVDFNVDIDRDVDWLYFHRLYFNLMSSTGRREKKDSQ
jgi:hypothetical protein